MGRAGIRINAKMLPFVDEFEPNKLGLLCSVITG